MKQNGGKQFVGIGMAGSCLPGILEVGAAALPRSASDGGTCAAGLEVRLLYTRQEALHQVFIVDIVLIDCNSKSDSGSMEKWMGVMCYQKCQWQGPAGTGCLSAALHCLCLSQQRLLGA